MYPRYHSYCTAKRCRSVHRPTTAVLCNGRNPLLLNWQSRSAAKLRGDGRKCRSNCLFAPYTGSLKAFSALRPRQRICNISDTLIIFFFSDLSSIFSKKSVKNLLDSSHKFLISLICRELGVIVLYLVSALEEKTSLACLYHTKVIVAVAAGDGVITDRLESAS